MIERDENGGVIDVAAFLNELEDLEDGELDPIRTEALMKRLKESRAARQLYLEYFQDSASLRDIGKTLEERGKLPVVGSGQDAGIILRRSVLAAAALVVLCAIIAAMFQIQKPSELIVSSAAVAGTKWSVDGQTRKSAEEDLVVRTGMTVRVTTGSVRFKQQSGATLVIQGPAEVSFLSLQSIDLRSGWLWIDSGAGDEDFSVNTPHFVVKDIGTRFGIRVPEVGPMEVHLVEGLVEVSTKVGERQTTSLAPDGKGKGFTTEAAPEELPLAYDPFPVISGLLADEAVYSTTLLGQSPVGYWTLNESAGGQLANEVPGASIAFHGMAVSRTNSGAGNNSASFGKGNGSLYLDGSALQSAIAGIDGPRGVLRREGAVSFWIRRSKSAERRDEILWLAGSSTEDRPLPDRAMMHTRLTRSGHVEFLLEDDHSKVELSSARDIVDGQWHHVAASWGPGSVDLYVDGQRTTSGTGVQVAEEGSFSGRYVRFGKPSLDLVGSCRPFTGWVDEIALWNRALSPTEIISQYQSATEPE